MVRYLRFILVICFVYFFASAFYELGSIPIQNDESDLVLKATGIINAVTSGQWGRLPFFLMVDPYIGTAKAVGLIPFIVLSGKTVVVFRAAWILYSGITLLCMYYVFSRWFCEVIGIFTVILMSTQSYFIRSVRISLFRQEIPVLCFFWCALALFERYRQSRCRWWLFAAGVFAGVGLWDKIMFAAYIVGAVVAFLCCGQVASVFKRIKQDLWLPFAGFLCGVLPFAVFNIIHFLITPKYLFSAVLSPSHAGRKNTMLVDNLIARVGHYFELISSGVLLENMPVEHVDKFFAWGFAASLGVVVLWLVCGRLKMFSKRLIAGVLVFYSTVLFLSCFVPKAANPAHLLVMCPFAELICVLAACILFSFIKNRKLVVGLVVVLLCSRMYVQARVMNDFYVACMKGQGYLCSFDGMHELAEYLIDEKISIVYSPDWYPAKLKYTSAGKVNVVSVLDMPAGDIGSDPFMAAPDARRIEKFLSLCPDEDFYLVLSIPDGKSTDCVEVVRNILASSNRKVVLRRFFRHKDTTHGRTLYVVKKGKVGQ